MFLGNPGVYVDGIESNREDNNILANIEYVMLQVYFNRKAHKARKEEAQRYAERIVWKHVVES